MAEEGIHELHVTKKVPTVTNAERGGSSDATEAEKVSFDDPPMSPRNFNKNPFSRQHTSLEVDDYFSGPRDISRHSKWPIFLRMHGSILPKMILPLLFVGAWSTLITCISFFRHNLGISNLLLTITGFVVSLGLSFRSSTAYERYNEGRKYWTQLILSSQSLARVIWVHGAERWDEDHKLGKQDLLAKMTALNLITAFAVSLKHKLRFEPYTAYEDLEGLVGHLDTFAKAATKDDSCVPKKVGFFKNVGEHLGVSFAESNPRKLLKKSKTPLGNLPLEILTYLAAYIDETIEDGKLKIPMQQTLAYNNLASLNDVLTGTDRILNTPLPVAYSIAIAQMTWVYILLLPFQLYNSLNWVTIPGSILAAYLILGLLLIGTELENPFGYDVNDLPLDSFCQQIANEIDIISSIRKPNSKQWITKEENKVLWPVSNSGYSSWEARSESRIRSELRSKTNIGFEIRRSMNVDRPADKITEA
ncbi:uncharacterized protein PV09_06091 [Verruconis gallopava]|uniref:Uncharacterized protein n=1 Tax=Verruconis gallopava TaxID=253628 RepID=A0A0D2A7C9_9PEZI|nr:uncharacterized protein PV09_06091 [Verruconis gallopava]KIW02653.1 hypothetical protein PV09_06091 [Verruconis gallopava]